MMPEGWRNERFGNIATFRNGLNFTRGDTGEAVKIVGVKDFKDLKSEIGYYDGIMCLQTLSWISNYNRIVNAMIKLNPKWIMITSLFYDGPVDAKIIIKDYSRSMGKYNYRSSHISVH